MAASVMALLFAKDVPVAASTSSPECRVLVCSIGAAMVASAAAPHTAREGKGPWALVSAWMEATTQEGVHEAS